MADKEPKDDKKKAQPIIVKRIKKGGGHHGGAWKVAYADFVTAMMAFFLLLWLLNVTTDEQKNAISNYFDPTHPKVSEAVSGAGGVMGGLSMAPQGSMATTVQPVTAPPPSSTVNKRTAEKAPTSKTDSGNVSKKALEKAKEELRKQEEKRFEEAKKQIEEAIQKNPDLSALAKNLLIDMTPEGLRIQVVDQDGKPMFPSGSAQMFDYTKKLIMQVATVIQKLPNEISVRGHTDSVPYGKDASYTNWELSADRANSSRRVLIEGGFPVARLNNVVGKADTDHLDPKNPAAPINRRISIILLKEELTNPDFDKKAAEAAKAASDEDGNDNDSNAPAGVPVGTFKKTQGAVEFP
jgi:chemotaxis protein MotB